MLKIPLSHKSVQSIGAMDKQSKVYSHYNHTDSCRFSRWNARESFHFMHARPWNEVVDFYSKVVNGHFSLADLFGTQQQPHSVHDDVKITGISDNNELDGAANEDKSGRWARANFKILLSYHGGSFDGWQKQPGLNTVQDFVERSLGIFVDEKKAQLLKEKSKPLEGCALVAGRTDKGVSAIQQVCSFYTWRRDVKPGQIEDAINNAEPGKLRVVSVSEVSRAFHPNFSAKWRRYLYIFPFHTEENKDQGVESDENDEDFSFYNYECHDGQKIECVEPTREENIEDSIPENEIQGAKKPRKFSVHMVNRILQQLEGKLLSYKMFARDTKASRNIGPPTECFIYHARAMEASLPSSECGKQRQVMCVELVGNRFLRKMVRVLVATCVREAAAGADEDALLKLMDATCRRATAPPAPPDGLCLVDVGYKEFDPTICFIP